MPKLKLTEEEIVLALKADPVLHQRVLHSAPVLLGPWVEGYNGTWVRKKILDPRKSMDYAIVYEDEGSGKWLYFFGACGEVKPRRTARAACNACDRALKAATALDGRRTSLLPGMVPYIPRPLDPMAGFIAIQTGSK